MSLLDFERLKTLHQLGQSEARHVDSVCRARSPATTKPWSLGQGRPTYCTATTKDEEPIIPAPHIFAFPTQHANESNDDASEGVLPSVAECATHLELLEVFFKLRSDIINSPDLDTVFGVEQVHPVVYRYAYGHSQRQPVKLKDPDWTEKRRKKWGYFLSLAVARFDLWVDIAASTVPEKEGVSLQLPYLPPLDILMVWHAFLLNPKFFQQYCQIPDRYLYRLRSVSFLWQEIHNAIDPSNFTYTLPTTSAEWYTTTFNLPADLFTYLSTLPKNADPDPILEATAQFSRRKFTGTSFLSKHLADLRTNKNPPPDPQTVSFLEMLYHASSSTLRLKPLVDNITRQAAFIDKMHRHLWIRAPSLEGTLRRSVERYDSFLRLFALYPGEMLVPTLDIDLVWHTHQLSAGRYQRDMLAWTGRFVDHDDKLGSGALKGRMERTREVWKMRVGGEYEVCLCWECEAVVDTWEGMWDEVVEGSVEKVRDTVQAEVEYYRVVEMARRRGWKMLPVRSEEGKNGGKT